MFHKEESLAKQTEREQPGELKWQEVIYGQDDRLEVDSAAAGKYGGCLDTCRQKPLKLQE